MAPKKSRSWLLVLVLLVLLTILAAVPIGFFLAASNRPSDTTPVVNGMVPPPSGTAPPSFVPPGAVQAGHDWKLNDAAGLDAEPIPTTPLPPLVYLDEVDPYGDERPTIGTGLLRRELYRQAVLLAAREELGLTTRDASLGEPPPTGLTDAQRLRVTVRMPTGAIPREIRVEAGAKERLRKVWAGESSVVAYENVMWAVGTAEELSRGKYVTALRRAGGWAPTRRPKSEKPLPAAVETAIARPTVVSQLAAVRGLHAFIRENGESAAALAALSRGYANLGVLTDLLWDGTTWVFKARSLLYAERLRRLDEAAPDGLWARGYAFALAGRHAEALTDFATADRAAAGKPSPAWVPLAVAVSKFDSAALRSKTEDGPLADTALLFLFLTQEDWELSGPSRAIGDELLKRLPGCHRVIDSLARTGGLGQMRHFSQAGLKAMQTSYRDELDRVTDLPREVFRLVQDNGQLEELLTALADAGRDTKDRHEVSWAVLGRITTESRLTFIESHLSFLRYVLAVPSDEFLDEVRPLIANHPLFPVLAVYGFDADRQPEKARELLRKAPVGWYSTREYLRLIHKRFLTPADAEAMHHLAVQHGDFLYTDLYQIIRPILKNEEAVHYAEKLLEASPYSPLARARLLLAGTPVAKQFAATWEKECQHPLVSNAFAKLALTDKRTADAERHLERTLTYTKEFKVYSQLADLYRSRGDEEKALLTLQESLDAPAAGLEHAQARVKIANYYMAKKEYATARKYADAAAETWAGWAMLTASSCAEEDNDLAAAERWIARTSERYDNDARLWYFWCLRTGQGDAEKARQVLDAHLKRVGTPKLAPDRMAAAVALVADGNPKEAAKHLEACFTGQNHVLLMLAAILWDQAHNAKERDRLFAAIPATDSYAPLFQLFKDTLKKGEKAVPTEDELTAVWKALPEAEQASTGYLLGVFLKTRGETALAKPYLERSTKRTAPGALPPTLAGLALYAK